MILKKHLGPERKGRCAKQLCTLLHEITKSWFSTILTEICNRWNVKLQVSSCHVWVCMVGTLAHLYYTQCLAKLQCYEISVQSRMKYYKTVTQHTDKTETQLWFPLHDFEETLQYQDFYGVAQSDTTNIQLKHYTTIFYRITSMNTDICLYSQESWLVTINYACCSIGNIISNVILT